MAGGTDSENEDGTKKKRKFDSSAEDSDFAVRFKCSQYCLPKRYCSDQNTKR